MNVTCTTLKRSNSARLPRLISFLHQALPRGAPGGEEHLITPQVITLLQRAVRANDPELFAAYSEAVHQPGRAIVLRDLLEFVSTRPSIPLSEVEPASEIVKRFNTGAMSYGLHLEGSA